MGIFGGLSTDNMEKQEDRVGGGSWTRESDIYPMTIKAAYAGKSTSSNAQSVNFIFVDKENKEYRETFWVTDGQGRNYFHPKKQGSQERDQTKRNPLPGFNIVNDICMIATDKPLSQQTDEEKVFKVWDADAKAELPKAVPMLVDLLGKQVALAIYKIVENKTKKSDSSGQYEAIADEREVNQTEKALFPQFRCTVREAEVALENNGSVTDDAILNQSGENVGVFWDSWLEAHKGKVRDKRTIKDGAAGQSGRPGQNKAPTAQNGGGNNGGERKSLFNKG
jgi:hypothetical protein